MAFEQPLESDRIDDSSLFSSLVRKPITLILSALGGKEEDDVEDAYPCKDLLQTDENDFYRRESSFSMKRVSSNMSGLTKTAPSMVFSELSEFGESTEALNSLRRTSSNQESLAPKLSRKQLSWSDDMGKRLVHYQNKSAARHEPPEPQAQPVKSSLSRTRSVPGGMAKKKESRFLPRGLTQRRESDSGSAASIKNSDTMESGLDSPQWGWYIRTTPPTPEMYYSSRSIQTQPNPSLLASSHAVPSIQPNPVFQGLQKSEKKGVPMGWSSVPL